MVAAHDADAGDAELAETDVLGQRIAGAQKPHEMTGERDDRGDLERQPQVLDLAWKVAALLQRDAGALGEALQTGEQLRRRARRVERLDIGAGGIERIERDIDPV